MQRLGPALERTFGRPRAVLAISAHSLTREPALLGAARHEAIYDFGGFDDRLYTLRYDAPGEPALARELATALRQGGWPVHLVDQGGLDHGAAAGLAGGLGASAALRARSGTGAAGR
jgi:4,5-DOPA dioxygenase extradiol